MILGIIDTLNEWNDKFNGWAAEHMDSVWFGIAMLAGILVVSFWGIGVLNKRQ
jgi:hypothetical protein